MLNKSNHHPHNARIKQRGRKYYLDGKPIDTRSVSEAVKEYQHPFIEKEALSKVGPTHEDRLKPDGTLRKDEEVKELWKSKARFGDDKHAIICDYYNGKPIPVHETENLRNFISWEAARPKDWIPYWSEQAIWCPHSETGEITAGRLDMLFKNSKDEFFHVDWKFVQYPDFKYRVYCRCGAWQFGDVEVVTHDLGCSAIGPKEENKHLLNYKWMAYASNNSLYCEMLRRNYGFNVVESRLVFVHPKAKTYEERPVDFEGHRLVVEAIIGKVKAL